MGNFARKIIDAVQNLLLDKLFLRSIVLLLGIASLWGRRQPEPEAWVMMSLLFALLGVYLAAWVLGVVANHRIKLKGPLGGLHVPSLDGLAAWSELPSGGLDPPRPVRAVVMALGRRSPLRPWSSWISMTVFSTAFLFLFALAYRPAESLAQLHPRLAEESVRDLLWIWSTAVVALMVLRLWAIEQADRLEPEIHKLCPPTSGWANVALPAAFLSWMTLLAIFAFGWPIWVGGIPFVALVVGALNPAWRTRVMESVFGKRVETNPSRSDQRQWP
jgi:hypothetical protein